MSEAEKARGELHDNDARERIDVTGMHLPILREHADPKEGYEPVSMWLVGVFGVLLFWGGWYMATYSGGFRGDVLDERPADRFGPLVEEGPISRDPFAAGQRLFAAAGCVTCHQSSGGGAAGLTPPLAGSEWVIGEPARVKRIVLHGLTGPITVRGSTYSGEMPGFGARLNDVQVAAVLTFIRTNEAWGNRSTAIDAASVARTWAKTAARVRPWTAGELMGIHGDD